MLVCCVNVSGFNCRDKEEVAGEIVDTGSFTDRLFCWFGLLEDKPFCDSGLGETLNHI